MSSRARVPWVSEVRITDRPSYSTYSRGARCPCEATSRNRSLQIWKRFIGQENSTGTRPSSDALIEPDNLLRRGLSTMSPIVINRDIV